MKQFRIEFPGKKPYIQEANHFDSIVNTLTPAEKSVVTIYELHFLTGREKRENRPSRKQVFPK